MMSRILRSSLLRPLLTFYLLLGNAECVSGVHEELADVIFTFGNAEGTECRTPQGQQGVCRVASLCLRAIFSGEFRLCGWRNFLPFVCCPYREESTTPYPSRPPTEPTLPSSVILTPDFDCGKRYVERFPVQFITGGTPARESEHPWMAAIGKLVNGKMQWFCGGALVNEYYVVSAAHCFTSREADKVRLGILDLSKEVDEVSEEFDVAMVTLHPDFRLPQLYYDVAVLRLRQRVTFNKNIRPVCLPPPGLDRTVENKVAQLTGWGDTSFGGESSPVLQVVDVTIFSNSFCDEAYKQLARSFSYRFPRGFIDVLLCAGDVNGGKDACQGDSGGPMVFHNKSSSSYTLVGVISSGIGCGHKDFPGIYTRVSHLTRWISQSVRKFPPGTNK